MCIRDSITTIIAAIILFIFGSGPVKGFKIPLFVVILKKLFSFFFIEILIKTIYEKIKKSIPDKAGLGGGSMNAASILRYLAHKRIINIKNKEMLKISKLIGSDVMLGLNHKSKILNSRNKIKYFNNVKKIYPLIIKPNFGCSTKDIYSKVRKFDKVKFGKGAKKMFDINFLKDMKNSLETVAFLKYPRLKYMKLYLENSLNPVFVRMTGSGSALVAYFQTKKRCERAKKRFIQKYKNIWCIASKTI